MPEENQVIITSARRKRAVAKCYVKKGKGRVYINGVPLPIYGTEIVRNKILEPIILAGKIAGELDIFVTCEGGGFMGQADACRTAVARGIVKFANNEEIVKIYRDYDRSMLAGDKRRTETEKWMRYGARRWRQKSYR
ncbi:30S ribosomal protein S9 [Sulfolobales archaeon HS-7]|nr:30S ribosomal protein S9 [Sulfolobales archaeon HS-7]